MINPENNIRRHTSEATVKGFAFIIVLNYHSGKLLMVCLKIFRVINTEIFHKVREIVVFFIVVQLLRFMSFPAYTHEDNVCHVNWRSFECCDLLNGTKTFTEYKHTPGVTDSSSRTEEADFSSTSPPIHHDLAFHHKPISKVTTGCAGGVFENPFLLFHFQVPASHFHSGSSECSTQHYSCRATQKQEISVEIFSGIYLLIFLAHSFPHSYVRSKHIPDDP